MIPLLILLTFVALGFAAFDAIAAAQIAPTGPFDPALLVTYGWVVLISMLGGVASFYSKVKSGQTRWINLSEFFGELCTSALAGLMTYWLCISAGINPWLTAALVGISGHMGSRALFMGEKILERWTAKTFGAPSPEQDPNHQ